MREYLSVKNDNIIEQKHYFYFDALRVFAIFFVIFNHTGKSGFFLFSQYSNDSFLFWSYLLISIFCKFAVPVFFAISGALLIKKFDEPIKVLFKKRVFIKVLTLFVFSVLYYCIFFKHPFSTFHKVWEFLGMLWECKLTVVYWFLYAYIGYLILLPILRCLVKNFNRKMYFYLFIIFIIFICVIPMGQYIMFHGSYKITEQVKVQQVFNPILIYPVLGYFLHNFFVVKTLKKLLWIWLFNFSVIALCALLTYYRWTLTGDLKQPSAEIFYGCSAFLNCVSIFLSARYIFDKVVLPKSIQKSISSVASCTFGIYLLHVIFLKLKVINDIYYFCVNTLHFDLLLACFVKCFVVMFVCYCITLICMKIPYINKLIK